MVLDLRSIGTDLPSRLILGWDVSACRLQVEIDTLTCCNVYLKEHFVGISGALLPVPLVLGRPFLDGSLLHILPRRVFGPFAGRTSSLPVPPDPSLVGFTFAAQAVPVFFTTNGLRTDYGITQGVEVRFL